MIHCIYRVRVCVCVGGLRPLVFKGQIVVYICIYELCFLYCYCICIIYACSSLVEEIKNIIIIILSRGARPA